MSMLLITDDDIVADNGLLQQVGGKAAALLELRRLGQPVPPFFVVTTDAIEQVLAEGDEDASTNGSRTAILIRERLAGAALPEGLEAALQDHHPRLCPRGELLAVRSSAVAEDGAQHSFAGIFDSELGVRDFETLRAAVRQVWMSALGERALAYRRQAGLPQIDTRMGVIVQRMVDARRAGVCFTCNPATGADDELVIHATFGVGEGLLSLGLPADSFVVNKQTLAVASEIADKGQQWRLDLEHGGLRRIDVPEQDRRRPSLSDEQVREVARAAIAIEAAEGRPQDIEFCFDESGDFSILQARPVTALAPAVNSPTENHETGGASVRWWSPNHCVVNPSFPRRRESSERANRPRSLDPRLRGDDGRVACPWVQATTIERMHPETGNVLVWDNSNIIESYSGVTTPMTFSFIRRAYRIVYHCFAEVMGIPPGVVREQHRTFENMLGLFRGRVYYNLKNWYRLVQLFPGYRSNSRFMESMMGVREPLVLEEQPPQPSLLRRWFVEFPGLLMLVTRSGWNFCRIRSHVARFHEHFEQHIGPYSQVDFDELPPHEIMQAYESLEDALLWNWKAPIINDFFVMIHYGLLKTLCSQWCGDADGSLQNDLVCGEGGLQSDEPARKLLELAGLVRADDALLRLFEEHPTESLPARVADDPRFAEFHQRMQRYLDEYGLRCVGELKLETRSYRDEPQRVFQIIRDYVANDGAAMKNLAGARQRERDIRADAERRCRAAFSNSPTGLLQRMLFGRVLRNARMGIRNRENMRFARTRIYGLLRQMLRSIGRRFADEGLLETEDDIFYLTLDEVWDFISGTAVSTDLRGLARVRRREYDRYRDGSVPAPGDRFVTTGMACHGPLIPSEQPADPVRTSGRLTGTGCCPGIVTGRTQRILDPNCCEGFAGDILVAERTDPGWVPFYPAFAGILIERGSVLSHSAIVAREMGIPTIVGIAGLTAALTSGQQVRMDGRAGTVEILDPQPVAPGEAQAEEERDDAGSHAGDEDLCPSPATASTTSSI